MEVMKQTYTDVLCMPYPTFLHILKWKADLEEERRKKFEDKVKTLKTSKPKKPVDISKRIKRR